MIARETGSTFDPDLAPAWGTLPEIFRLAEAGDHARYLRSYTQTYLREEIVVEQLWVSGAGAIVLTSLSHVRIDLQDLEARVP